MWCWVLQDLDRFLVSSGNHVERASSVSRETSGEVSHPDSRHLVLRITAYEHDKYKECSQLAHTSICFPAVQPPFLYAQSARKQVAPTHVATSGRSNEHGDSRSRETEPVSTLDGYIASRAFSLIKNPSLYLDRAALHLNLHPYLSFRLTYRNHIARRSKSGVYAKVVCRKCGGGIAEERRSDLDTSTTPVCPLFPQYVNSLVDVHV